MAHYRTPGVSVTMVDDCRIAWSAGYGVEADAVFQAASISKLVTATGALRLVEQDRLALDRDLTSLVGDRGGGGDLTLRRLLAHSAGVNMPGFPGYPRGSDLPTLSQTLDGAPPAAGDPIRAGGPMDQVRYSGGGYLLVEAAMEAATGDDFVGLMKRSVLTPAGMENSTFATEGEPALLERVAVGHGFAGDPHDGGWNLYPEHAAASLWTTSGDLAQFAIALMEAWQGQQGSLLSPATAQTMLTPYRDAMGLGPGVHGEGRDLHFDHAGWNRGYRSYVIGWPARCQALVVLTNSDGGKSLISEILRATAATYGWPGFEPRQVEVASLSAARASSLEGRYNLSAGFPVDVVRRHDGLILQTLRGDNFTLLPLDENRFVAAEDGANVVFAENAIQLWNMTGQKAAPESGEP
jgi:CubicO group peptidase (beta-lactamase class C family)